MQNFYQRGFRCAFSGTEASHLQVSLPKIKLADGSTELLGGYTVNHARHREQSLP